MNQPASQTASQDLTGQQLGDYQVLRRIGSGGMAEVYLAEQRSLSRQVALKVLHANLATDNSYIQRFAQEARAAASLVHPNIVQIFEVGQIEGIHFIAQEYVPGKNLGQVLERQGALDQGLVLDVMRQVVSALCKSHELGIVHRDIKPENVMLSHSGAVKVADFGLARVTSTDTKTLTQVGVAMGTPLYMSPEQIEGRALDIRSDIYSLGVTCYHLLTGSAPFDGETALAIAMQHVNATPEPLENVQRGLSSALARTVHQMIAKKAENRPANPGELLLALRSLATAAAEEGWAEKPEAWSLADWIAVDQGRDSHLQLSELMRQQTELQTAPRKWRASAVVLSLIAGVLFASLLRSDAYLRGSQAPTIPRRETVEAQLYHAKLTNSPAAWESVQLWFPQADPYLLQLAKQGLVRHYLLVSQQYQRALSEIRQLEDASLADPSNDRLAAFVFASKAITCANLGRAREAQAALDQLTPERRDLLRAAEKQISDLLSNSIALSGE